MSNIIIKEMVLDGPGQVTQLETSISNIDNQIEILEEKRDSIKEDICDQVALNLEEYLLLKFSPSVIHMQKGPNYNQSFTSSGSIIDWNIYERVDCTSTCSSSTEFVTSGDTTSIFIPSDKISFDLVSSVFVYSTINSSVYNEEDDETTITIDDAVLEPETFLNAWIFKYSYVSGDDSTIDNFKTQWDFGQDYLILPMGTSGTYGILDNIDKLTIAKNLLLANKTKINDSITILEPFQ